MPIGLERVAAFLHPVIAILTLALLAYVASLGLRSRERGGAALRPRHARLAPRVYALMLLNFAFGAASTWLWRADLELGGGAHFRLGMAIVVLLGVVALLAPRIRTSPVARQVHPLLGMLALLLAALQVFFGMALLPL